MRRRVLLWALFFGCWTAAGLLVASQWYLTSTVVGPPVTWGYVLTWVLPDWYIWALLSALVLALARRYPIEHGTLRRSIPVHLAASVLFSLAHAFAFAAVTYWAPAADVPEMTFAELWYALTLKRCLTSVLTYWVVLGLGRVFDYHRRYREREAQASRLEAQLARAQLDALRAQIHPHFLFNALNAVSELIHRDAREADRMVVRLSDLLRASLDAGAVDVVPLRREIELVERYLDVERMRFHDRLSVGVRVDPACLDATVPHFILHPLVENAIRHGVAARPGAGRIDVEATRDGATLVLSVRDDGPGLASGPTAPGIGLTNARTRLEQLYGPRGRLELRDVAGGGLDVRLEIPLSGAGEARGA